MKKLMAYFQLAVFRWLSGDVRAFSTALRWFRRRRRLENMLRVARRALLRLEAQYGDAATRVREFEEAGERLKRAGERELDEATVELVEALMRAEPKTDVDFISTTGFYPA